MKKKPFEVGQKIAWVDGRYTSIQYIDKIDGVYLGVVRSKGKGECNRWIHEAQVITRWRKVSKKPKKVAWEFWVNIYGNGDAYIYRTKEKADLGAGNQRSDCIRVREVLDEN